MQLSRFLKPEELKSLLKTNINDKNASSPANDVISSKKTEDSHDPNFKIHFSKNISTTEFQKSINEHYEKIDFDSKNTQIQSRCRLEKNSYLNACNKLKQINKNLIEKKPMEKIDNPNFLMDKVFKGSKSSSEDFEESDIKKPDSEKNTAQTSFASDDNSSSLKKLIKKADLKVESFGFNELEKNEINKLIAKHPKILEINFEISSLHFVISETMKEMSQSIVNPYSQQNKEEMFGKPLETHSNIKCNGCIAFSIRGKRFKCLQCPDFNLCEKCEKKVKHNHIMIRFSESIYGEKVKNIIELFSIKEAVQDFQNSEKAKKVLGLFEKNLTREEKSGKILPDVEILKGKVF